MPKTIKMEAIMMRIVLQLAEMKTPPMVIPVPDPSSLDSTLNRLIIPEPLLEPGRLCGKSKLFNRVLLDEGQKLNVFVPRII